MSFEVQADAGNIISVSHDLRGRPRIHVQGTGNQLVIGPGCNLNNSQVLIRGNNSSMVIGAKCVLRGEFKCLRSRTSLVIGDCTTAMNLKAYLHEAGAIDIGEDCMFSGEVIIDNSDMHSIIDRSSGRRINPPGDVKIGNHVWVGYGVYVTPGVSIGEGSVIGTRAVVTRDIPANCVAAGVPARVIRTNTSWARALLPYVQAEMRATTVDLSTA
jgi:acetyltransferase-like isoleucine patch superfamily enzyme